MSSLIPFGSVLSNASNIILVTADGIKKNINVNKLSMVALRIMGLPHIGLRMRTRKILKLLDCNKDDMFLDAGCGMGLYLLSLSLYFRKGFGVDRDIKKISEGKKLSNEISLKNLSFQLSDLCNLPFKNEYFNKIICSEVIEHIKDDKKALSEICRVLKQDGTFILTTTSDAEMNVKHEEVFDHERPGYSRKDLEKLVKKSGFSIVSIEPYGLTFGKIAWDLNRKMFSSMLLTGITFYPLLLLTLLDDYINKSNSVSCIGYVLKLKKL